MWRQPRGLRAETAVAAVQLTVSPLAKYQPACKVLARPDLLRRGRAVLVLAERKLPLAGAKLAHGLVAIACVSGRRRFVAGSEASGSALPNEYERHAMHM